jgi:hypothetical protein
MAQRDYPLQLQNALDKITKRFTTEWFNKHFASKDKLRKFVKNELKHYHPNIVGFFKLDRMMLTYALFTCNEKWQVRRQFLFDGLKSLLFNFRKVHLTMTQIVVLVMVTNYGVFVSNQLSSNMIQVLSEIEVPHCDSKNKWTDILWSWVTFCQTYTGGVASSCKEMSMVFIRVVQIIIDTIQQRNKFEKHEPYRVEETVLSPNDVVLSENEYCNMCIGMNDPEDIAQNEEEFNYLTLVLDFMKGDFTNLTSLILQMQISSRVLKIASDPRASMTSHLIEHNFSSIRLEEFHSAVLDQDTRYEVFRYPRVLSLKETQYIEARVSLEDCKDKRNRKTYSICLPLVVFSFVFTDAKTIDGLKDLLRKENQVDTVNELFQVNDTEATILCQGVNIPRRWLKYPTIKALC